MNLISSFDILSDFYSDPQLKILFKDEYKRKVSSKVMWALMLYIHPDSKFSGLDSISRKELIEKDYLSSKLDWKAQEPTIEKISKLLLTKTQRLLIAWEDDLEDRDRYMKSMPYNAENFEIKEKLMTNRLKMWESYLAILKKASAESDAQAQGDTELSLSEKHII